MRANKSILFCFVGPGGGGKSTICKKIVERVPLTRMSISSTTRTGRPGEVEGRDKYFLTKEDFEKRIKNGELIEYTVFNGHYYGTEKRTIEKAIADEVDLILDIEVEGVGNMKKMFGEQVVTSFVMTPSLSDLEKRLTTSGNRDEQEIKSRLQIAKREIAILTQEGFSDYLLINDKLEESICAAEQIIQAERRRYKRMTKDYLSMVLNT